MDIVKKIAKKYRDILYMCEAVYISQWNQWRNPSFVCTGDTKRCTHNRKSPYFRYEYFGKNTPVCCASHLFCILRDVVDVLEKHDLEYFIFFGTLLGAVRHQGFIQWDTDVDIIIPFKNIEKTHRILQEELQGKYMISDESNINVAGGLLRVFLSETNTLQHLYYINLPLIFGYNLFDNITLQLGIEPEYLLAENNFSRDRLFLYNRFDLFGLRWCIYKCNQTF